VNVTSSSTVVATLEAARDAKSPIILQTSQGGAAFFAGKGVDNKNQEASIAGSVAAAHYIRSIAPIYGVPVVLHTDHCAKSVSIFSAEREHSLTVPGNCCHGWTA
jgi:fructose-bisphosphate aldolase class II